MPIDPLWLEIGAKWSLAPPHGFRRAEKQDPALTQGEMEQREDSLLNLGPQVDEKVAAADQIEARKRRIGHHVMDGEHDRRAAARATPDSRDLPG